MNYRMPWIIIASLKKPKLTLPDIAVKNQVTLDLIGSYCVNTAYIIVSEKKGLLAILNSTLVLYFYGNITSSIRGGYLRFIRQYLEQIPIATLTLEQNSQLETLTNQILTAKATDPTADTAAAEAEIDRLVYALYGLTPEEIAIVEGRA